MYGLGNIDLQKYNPFPSFQSGQAEAIAQILRGRTLSPKQRSAAERMVKTYKKQLEKGGIII